MRYKFVQHRVSLIFYARRQMEIAPAFVLLFFPMLSVLPFLPSETTHLIESMHGISFSIVNNEVTSWPMGTTYHAHLPRIPIYCGEKERGKWSKRRLGKNGTEIAHVLSSIHVPEVRRKRGFKLIWNKSRNFDILWKGIEGDRWRNRWIVVCLDGG